jgi:hypothetical protein
MASIIRRRHHADALCARSYVFVQIDFYQPFPAMLPPCYKHRPS